MVIMLLPILDSPTPVTNKMLLFENPFLPVDFLLHALCILFSFFNFFVLLPKLYQQKKKTLYFLSILCCFLFIASIPLVLKYDLLEELVDIETEISMHGIILIRHVFFLFSIIFLFNLTIWLERIRLKVKQERNFAELQFLKAQMKPHFLFNTLNMIYSQNIANPKKANHSILKLADMMRYFIESTNKDVETLAQTVQYLESYLELQKERFEDRLIINWQTHTENETAYTLPSLILLTFVENAFKYGISSAEKCTITICLSQNKNQLDFQVVNKDFSHQVNHFERTGIGITNTLKRLDIINPERYTYEVIKENGFYTLQLHLKLGTV